MAARGKTSAGAIIFRLHCEQCGKQGGGLALRTRLNPSSLAIAEEKLLCLPCGQAGGWYQKHNPRDDRDAKPRQPGVRADSTFDDAA
jgi:hypothetical protein